MLRVLAFIGGCVLAVLNLSACLETAAPAPSETSPSAAMTVSADPEIWQSLTLSFEGPNTSELAEENPFTDYRLLVEFTSGDARYLVRGFYAADGNAAQSSAEAGGIWQARFTPDQTGEWRYSAVLRKGKMIAVSRAPDAGEVVAIAGGQGSFKVGASTASAPDFRAPDRGFLGVKGGYFQFKKSGEYWLKGGPNSPENLLAYTGFDGTYRMEEEARRGESAATGGIHDFAPHLADWRAGDPLWGDGQGKSIIGAMNYLANQEMNTAYFLTLNILGDGKDVWPYRDPDDVMRFDVSKLEQWNILFSHMQSKGILLHIVTQETENELWLDGGDTGPQRQLYLAELIARFGHHPALVWNLGEENGPVVWRPEGQNDAQRMAMIDFITAHDPYDHPILLHTHAQADEKDHIAGPLLGYAGLDGLSFQVADRRTVFAQTRKWREQAKAAGQDWLITMDEIGPWHMGAAPDSFNPTHNSLRRYALWGHFLGGGAGVEWYFGARFPDNDLTVEDWRTRETLWGQTRIALDFFEQYLPFWEMGACPENTIDRPDVYCAAKPGEDYALYLPEGGTGILQLPKDQGFDIFWYDPLRGGSLQQGDVKTVQGSNWIELGFPPKSTGEDWVVLIRKQK